MKTPNAFLVVVLASAGMSLSSCVVPVDYYGYPAYGYYPVPPVGFVGDAYWYGGRYYYGGHYHPGRHYYHGRYYDGRYYHQGRYYYGGRYQHHGGHGGHHRWSSSLVTTRLDSRRRRWSRVTQARGLSEAHTAQAPPHPTRPMRASVKGEPPSARLQQAVEVFVRGFCFTRGFTHPYVAERVRTGVGDAGRSARAWAGCAPRSGWVTVICRG